MSSACILGMSFTLATELPRHKIMKLSQLISELKAIKTLAGDLDVVICNSELQTYQPLTADRLVLDEPDHLNTSLVIQD